LGAEDVVQTAKASSLLFDLFFGVWTAPFAVLVVLFWMLGRPRRPIRKATRIWARGVLIGLKGIVGLQYTERGRDKVPAEPCLIIANHQSTWETIAFLVLFPDVAMVAKRELLKIPVFGWFLRNSPMIIIDRDMGVRTLRDMLEQSRAALADRRSVLIFPEGSRKAPLDPITFHRGVELLYAKLETPVLPVAVNSGNFWRPGQPYKRSGTIVVSYLPPIPPNMPAAEFSRAAEALLSIERAALH
jgi:1-acyl-sn-glycerol-3-phosphate acyltransferase